MKTPTLETERLILRPISLDDAPAIQKHFNDWEIIKNLTTAVPWPYPDNGAETFIRNNALPNMSEKGHMIWVLVPKSGPDEAIGIIDFGLNKTAHGDRGFWISRQFEGQGLMTEAIAKVNDFLFFELGIKKYKVSNAVSNKGSRRVKEKTGAVFIGHGTLEHNSGENTIEVWEVTKENWEKIRKSSLQS